MQLPGFGFISFPFSDFFLLFCATMDGLVGWMDRCFDLVLCSPGSPGRLEVKISGGASMECGKRGRGDEEDGGWRVLHHAGFMYSLFYMKCGVLDTIWL